MSAKPVKWLFVPRRSFGFISCRPWSAGEGAGQNRCNGTWVSTEFVQRIQVSGWAVAVGNAFRFQLSTPLNGKHEATAQAIQ